MFGLLQRGFGRSESNRLIFLVFPLAAFVRSGSMPCNLQRGNFCWILSLPIDLGTSASCLKPETSPTQSSQRKKRECALINCSSDVDGGGGTPHNTAYHRQTQLLRPQIARQDRKNTGRPRARHCWSRLPKRSHGAASAYPFHCSTILSNVLPLPFLPSCTPPLYLCVADFQT